MTMRDYIENLYLALLEEGWKIHEIDQMDLLHFLDLTIRRAKQTKKQDAVPMTTIDKVAW